MKKVQLLLAVILLCGPVFSVCVTGQTSTPFAEKTWESAAIGECWGLEVVDIDDDGEREILAMGSGNVINIYSTSDFALEGNITIPSTGGGYLTPSYSKFEVAQMDGDDALEIVCQSETIFSGFVVIDSSTKAVEWEDSNYTDDLTTADVDGDGMAELIAGDDAIKVYDVDTQTLKGVSDNITYYGDLSYIAMMRQIEVGDVIAGGNLEIVVLVDEFSGSGRLFILDSHTLDFQLNTSISGSVQCLDLSDIDGDGALEIIVGEGGVVMGTLTYYGHIRIYNAVGALEWESEDLGEMVNAIAVGDVDDDDALDLVTASDRIKVRYASNKSTIWSGPNIISTGDEDCLVLADLDGDGMLDIITRASAYSSGNRVLVYNVNGVVTDSPDDGDDDDDGTDDDSGDGTDEETNGDGGGGLGFDLTLVTVSLFVGIGVAIATVSRRRN